MVVCVALGLLTLTHFELVFKCSIVLVLARAGLPIEQSTSVQVLAAAHNTNPTMAPLGFIG